MNETMNEVLREAPNSPETSEGSSGWVSPGFTIVETALEVTAYAFADR
jgi:coenzyme PQQ precursor peptide PqqA